MAQSFSIAGRQIGHDAPTFIIAEIGINHDGSEETAARMVAEAAAAGADAVKFQTVSADESYLPRTKSFQAFKGKELTLAALRRLSAQARAAGMICFSTPGDMSSLRLMLAAELPAIKISSGQLTNTPLLQAAGATKLPLIMSSGMADLAETSAAVDIARSAGASAIALLHCTSLYPAPADTLNLRAIATMKAALNVPVGYSDHHLGTLACIAAVAAGGCILEKHFTLDARMPGADHAISVEPREFAEMVRSVREIERMLGSAEKAPTAEEMKLRVHRYRYLVARAPIAAGDVLSAESFLAKRIPAGTDGIPAAQLSTLLGRRAACAIAAEEVIRPDMIRRQT